jgi:hypothetical protein
VRCIRGGHSPYRCCKTSDCGNRPENAVLICSYSIVTWMAKILLGNDSINTLKRATIETVSQ